MNIKSVAFIISVLCAALVVSACNDGTTPRGGCTPGAVVACACAGGTSGVQTCSAAGAYGSCVGCSGADAGTAYCGDGACNGGESCSTCSTDCGVCAPVCGDGACAGGEACTTCPSDCGACPPTCGPSTCTGCCDGAVCRSGDIDSACGAGGLACRVCSGDFACDYILQSCTLGYGTTWGISIDDVTVSPTNYLGSAWDAFGGAPDPKVCVWVASDTTSHCTGSATDVFTTTFLPGVTTTAAPADIAATLGFAVYDVDVSSDDRVGSCHTTFDSSNPLPTTPLTMTCPVEAATMNSGFTVHYHLSPY